MAETEFTPRQPDSPAYVMTPEPAAQGVHHSERPVILCVPASGIQPCDSVPKGLNDSDSAMVIHICKLSCETEKEDNNSTAVNNLTTLGS